MVRLSGLIALVRDVKDNQGFFEIELRTILVVAAIKKTTIVGIVSNETGAASVGN